MPEMPSQLSPSGSTGEQTSMPNRVKDPRGKSQVLKRAVKFDGRKTSVSLEDAFWDALHEIAAAQGSTLGGLFATIDSERREREHTNLSSAIRLFVLDYYRNDSVVQKASPGAM
jgi:predicted DNA-binding ribbon-helix-helix protein